MSERYDTLPVTLASVCGAALTASFVSQLARRRVVVRRTGQQIFTANSGNVLAYSIAGDLATRRPVVVFECGLMSTALHWSWVVRSLEQTTPLLTYDRAGYGCSYYRGPRPYSLEVSIRDLRDLVRGVLGDRPIVLVGHSLGGYLIIRVLQLLHHLAVGAVLIDSSHPGELRRSVAQAQGAESLSNSLALMPVSLSLGLGMLLARPPWVDQLPAEVRKVAFAQYRDARMWRAGLREWRATYAEFQQFSGTLPRLPVHVEVVSATHTCERDPVQHELHDEIAARAPSSCRHFIDNFTHDELLMLPQPAAQVARIVETTCARADLC